jgi:hypothetical protein
MQVQCCVCQRVRTPEGWTEPESPKALREHVSHGYCPRCAAKALEEIRHFHAPATTNGLRPGMVANL